MDSEEAGCLRAALIVSAVGFGIWFAIWGKDMSIRYQWEYSVGADRVKISPRPTDCDFLTAPMGLKRCDYQKQVTVAIYRTDATGQKFGSIDDGKTWFPDQSGKDSGKGVFIWWKKETDQ